MNEPARRSTPQFDLSALLMLLLVVGVVAGIAFYFVEGQFATNTARRLNSQFIFIMLTLCAPLTLLVVVSVFRGLVNWFSRRR